MSSTGDEGGDGSKARSKGRSSRDVRMRGFRQRTTVADALAALDARLRPLDAERVALLDAAYRVAAEDVVARFDVPHFARAAMDGYALSGESTFGATVYAPARLRLVGEVFAGRPWHGTVAGDQAVRITTGGALPEGADAVVMAENADRPSEDEVQVTEPVPPGKHVGPVGEDVRAGSVVVSAGRRLRPQDLGVLASVGHGDVAVVRRPRVRILITGDELLPPGSAPEGARIVDSNGVVLSALVARDGGLPTIEYVNDGLELVRAAFESRGEDVLLVSGGSSVGPEDHAPSILAALGELTVHGIAMRPSSPAGFGFVRDAAPASRREPEAARSVSRPVFLLPGNPVSCLCAYDFFAGRAIRALGGRSFDWPYRAVVRTAAVKIVSEVGRLDYVRSRIDERTVHPISTAGASILSSTTRADGFVMVQADSEGFAQGDAVQCWLYDT